MSISNNQQWLLYLCCLIALYACTKDNATCTNANINIQVQVNQSHPCNRTGSIKIISPLGPSYQYKLNELPYQERSNFDSLSVGDYHITVKDNHGCTNSKKISIDTVKPNATFIATQQVLNSYCTPCHIGSNGSGGFDVTHVCTVLNLWHRIEARAILGIPTPMPRTGLIPVSERNKIIHWINNGHQY
ncbi:MAG TPA: hypothetical protein DCL43_12190 [Chitinophagaceae bacterium]|nr:hypothetical protein [Chitinophagaceae bacterium]HAN39168.1 hypothetical protein [Chitinophagaceae bacterium]